MAHAWSVLIVSEEEEALQRIAAALRQRGYRVLTASGGSQALSLLARDTIHVVLTDLKMRRVSGMDVLRQAHAIDPDIAVIMMTRFGSIPSAVEAMRCGAYDYLTKPVDLRELELIVQRAVAQWAVGVEVRELRRRLDIEYGFENIIGNSPAMRRIYRTIVQVAASAGTILLIGESGTGKELIARAIHRYSPRQHRPFIALNCAAFSEGLLENELFGHEPGAFTGANAQKRGLFELADGGVLFLDEIGEISLPTQAKLLRVLETREFLRVGGTQPITVDLAIISATNTNLEAAVQQKTFREDLYYRLRVVTIEVPPLRQRPEDIPLLVNAFLAEFNEKHHKHIAGLSADAMRRLLQYPWPGNVRELRNCLESLVILSRKRTIEAADLPSYIQPPAAADVIRIPVGTPLDEVEKEVIRHTLAHAKTKTAAARLLRIGLRTLHRKIKAYGLASAAGCVILTHIGGGVRCHSGTPFGL
jgi:DNA-binding NtrC family response regulator